MRYMICSHIYMMWWYDEMILFEMRRGRSHEAGEVVRMRASQAQKFAWGIRILLHAPSVGTFCMTFTHYIVIGAA